MRHTDVPTPKSYKEAVTCEFKEHWLAAIHVEIDNLRKHGVFEWVRREPGMKIMDLGWAFKVKPNELGGISRLKARCVLRGFRQEFGRDFIGSSAPVGKLQTFRALIAEAAQRKHDCFFLDVKSAYLLADLDIVQHVDPPKGLEGPEPGMVWRLVKSLYGSVQGARMWHKLIRTNLLSWGYAASSADSCLFVKKVGKVAIKVLLFVDDAAVFVPSTKEGLALRDGLLKHIKDEGYEFSTSDGDDTYLSMRVMRVKGNGLFLTQQLYAEDLGVKYGMLDPKTKEMIGAPVRSAKKSNAKPVSKEDCPAGDPKKNALGHKYRILCGSIRWLESCTRPDLSVMLGECAKVQANPAACHMEQLMYLLRYCVTTRDRGLMYGRKRDNSEPDGPLVVFTDSTWASDVDSYQSRGGFVCTAWQTPVSWSSYKIKSVAASSCEAEYLASYHATRESRWLRYLFSDLGYGDLTPTHGGTLDMRDYEREKLPDLFDASELPVMIACDNTGAVAVSANPVLHNRSKHVHLKYMWVRVEVNKGHCRLKYVNTKKNLADALTKGLARSVHERLFMKMMMTMDIHDDGKLVRDFVGNALPDWTPVVPCAERLYKVAPPGLAMADMLLPKVESKDESSKPWRDELSASLKKRVLAPDRELQMRETWESDEGMDKVNVVADTAELEIREHMKKMYAKAMKLVVALDALSTDLAQTLGACGIETAAGSREELQWGESRWKNSIEELRKCNAIVDSGASHTFVPPTVGLSDVRQADIGVSVANGEVERIKSIGNLGPLKDVRVLEKAAYALVSVRDLVELFGGVYFNDDGVFVVPKFSTDEMGKLVASGGKGELSCVGRPTGTKNRLYSFDLGKTLGHMRRR